MARRGGGRLRRASDERPGRLRLPADLRLQDHCAVLVLFLGWPGSGGVAFGEERRQGAGSSPVRMRRLQAGILDQLAVLRARHVPDQGLVESCDQRGREDHQRQSAGGCSSGPLRAREDHGDRLDAWGPPAFNGIVQFT